jgi:hypothetical protein
MLLRLAYVVAVASLIGGSAVMAQGIERDNRAERGAALVAIATWSP